MEEPKKTLAGKLLQFQTEIDAIKSDGKNTYFKNAKGEASNYATLENVLATCKGILNPLQIVITQPIKDGSVFTVLTDVESGETMESGIALPPNLTPQQNGSAITYYRRYTLASLLSIEVDYDDDGNAGSGVKTPTATTQDDKRPWLNKFKSKTDQTLTDTWNKAVEALQKGEVTVAKIEKKYKLSKELKKELEAVK